MNDGIETIQRAVRERGPDGDYRDLGDIVVRRRDHLLIFNYTNKATFARRWNAVERASRGLIVDGRSGQVVARPFDKFFNLGEVEETRLEQLPAERFEVFDKLDGSLGIMYQHNGAYAVATRGSFDGPQAQWATAWLREHHDMARSCSLHRGWTLLFEIIYPENRIVLDYGQERGLVLLAARHILTGDEMPYDILCDLADLYGFRVVERFPTPALGDLVERAGAATGIEGWVVRFAGGLRVKVKCDQYLALHRVIFGMTPERIREALLGDWLALLTNVPEELRPAVEAQAEAMRAAVRRELERLEALAETILEQERPGVGIGQPLTRDERRAVAQRIMRDHRADASYLFALVDGKRIGMLILKNLDLATIGLAEPEPVAEPAAMLPGGELAAARDLLIRGIGLANELGEGERWAAWRGDVAQLLNQLT